MVRYLITFSYDGFGFNGFQKQEGKRTIQEELENALTKINNGEKTEVFASGRTDKGVHALNQKAHFDLKIKITEEKLRMALNSNLPSDIYVKEAKLVENDFHARYMVEAKEYMYIINLGEYNPIERNHVYQYNKKLDVTSMERALKYFEGEHNFKSFSPSDKNNDNYIRTISQTNLYRDLKNPNIIIITFLGTGFLRHMVRTMIGTLIQVGEDKKKPEEIINIIEKEDRRSAGPTCAPEGLYLKNVFY